jgi:hypothetical protein
LILDLRRIQDISVWIRRVYAASVSNQLLVLNASNIKNSSCVYENIGGLECSWAYLSEKRRADGQGTQEDLLGWVLLLLWSPVAPPAAPPDS